MSHSQPEEPREKVPSTNSVPCGAAGFLGWKPAAWDAKVRELPYLRLGGSFTTLPQLRAGVGGAAASRGGCCCCCRRRCRGIDRSAQASREFGAWGWVSAQQPAACSKSRETCKRTQLSPYLGLRRRLHTQQASPVDLGRRSREGPWKGGVPAPVSPVDF